MTTPKLLLAAALSEAASKSLGASAARNRKLPARRTLCCCEMPKAPTQWQPRKGRRLAASVPAQVATALQSRPRSRQYPRKRWRVLFGRDQKLPRVQEEPEPRLPSHRYLQLLLPSQPCRRDLNPETVLPTAREPRFGNRRPLARFDPASRANSIWQGPASHLRCPGRLPPLVLSYPEPARWSAKIRSHGKIAAQCRTARRTAGMALHPAVGHRSVHNNWP